MDAFEDDKGQMGKLDLSQMCLRCELFLDWWNPKPLLNKQPLGKILFFSNIGKT